ncbi:hypothetical protein F5883DRAFT_564556 [Diaporthe sp. PMI_573]|nr:hypothetical protein F5883DRAFT_564556 [Diaporthaceae sp. PMI_573]
MAIDGRDGHGRHGPIATTWWILSLLPPCWCHSPKHDLGTGQITKAEQMGATESSGLLCTYRMTLCFTRNPRSSLMMLARRTASNGQARHAVG